MKVKRIDLYRFFCKTLKSILKCEESLFTVQDSGFETLITQQRNTGLSKWKLIWTPDTYRTAPPAETGLKGPRPLS